MGERAEGEYRVLEIAAATLRDEARVADGQLEIFADPVGQRRIKGYHGAAARGGIKRGGIHPQREADRKRSSRPEADIEIGDGQIGILAQRAYPHMRDRGPAFEKHLLGQRLRPGPAGRKRGCGKGRQNADGCKAPAEDRWHECHCDCLLCNNPAAFFCPCPLGLRRACGPMAASEIHREAQIIAGIGAAGIAVISTYLQAGPFVEAVFRAQAIDGVGA